ncbi:MAG: thiamine pyrophosphate-binding protein, partial [Thermodesulfobacteriota bacterium]
MAKVKVSDYVFRFLKEKGLKAIFMLPGGGAMHLVDSLGRSGLEYVCCLHEQGASIAAEAYAQYTGNLGCALVTTGPGGTNAITGCTSAWIDSIPVLFISGQVKTSDLASKYGVRQYGF